MAGNSPLALPSAGVDKIGDSASCLASERGRLCQRNIKKVFVPFRLLRWMVAR